MKRESRPQQDRELSIYSGTANPDLAAAVARHLGVPLGRRVLDHFPDTETHVQIEDSIRGRDIYIVQSTCPPVNENLMDLLVMIDAFHRAAAGRITAVIPYYGYARQEKKATGREPITARVVADLLTAVGTDRVVSLDLHSAAIQGFFSIEMDHLTATPLLIDYLAEKSRPDSVIVAPDAGRVKLADQYARALDRPLVVMYKRRLAAERVELRTVVGEVRGRSPIIVDDMISTGTTIHEVARALVQAEARPEIYVAATHPLLVGPALEYLSAEAIREVVVTDTIPIPPEKRLPKITVLSVARLLAEAVRRLNRNESISALFRARYDGHPV